MILRNILIAAAAVLCMACGSFHKPDYVDFSQEFPLEADLENSLEAKWAAKEVLASRLVEDMEGNALWEPFSIATVSYTDENSVDGGKSLRYHASLVDSVHIASNRSPWGSFQSLQGGEMGVSLIFDEPQDWSDYNRISIWVYIHSSKNPNVHFFLDVSNEGSPDTTISPSRQTNIDVRQGSWQNVVWEIDYIKRDRITKFTISQNNICYDGGTGEQYVTIDFDKLELQKVVPDHYEGWNIPKGHISFSHIGYRPEDKKVALAHAGEASVFSLVDGKGRTVYEGKAGHISNKGNDFAVLDFTGFDKEGRYSICYGSVVSPSFPIGKNVWMTPLFSALNFYNCQRCGAEVKDVHGVCHQDIMGFHGDDFRHINGGWHDAADLSQGFFRTSMACYAMMQNLQNIKSDPALSVLATRLEEEAAWGMKWLLDVSFEDGYHISWNTQRIYTDNVAGTADDIVTKAEFLPWECYMGVANMILAAEALGCMADRKAELEAKAVDKWEHAMKATWGWTVEFAWGATSSALLYKRFGDEKYKEAALDFGRKLLACQERTFVEGIPVTGYFYSGVGSRGLIHDNHVSFNEAPMLAFRELCRTFPDEAEWMDWYSAAAIYNEYFMKRGSAIASPFDIVPNGVFRRSDYGEPHAANYGLIQYEAGTQLNENYAIRTFPIWGDHFFHGGTQVHLSNAWAQAVAASMVNDKEGLALSQKQLEWVVGRNPFCQSLMYGVGYDYSPLYVYCTRNIVGALGVGVDSFNNDEPFWCATASTTTKEIWVSPVSRFLGTLATFLGEPSSAASVEAVLTADGNAMTAKFHGEGKHEVELRLFNAASEFSAMDLDLTLARDASVGFNISVIDPAKPYVVALIVDGDEENAVMLTGNSV